MVHRHDLHRQGTRQYDDEADLERIHELYRQGSRNHADDGGGGKGKHDHDDADGTKGTQEHDGDAATASHRDDAVGTIHLPSEPSPTSVRLVTVAKQRSDDTAASVRTSGGSAPSSDGGQARSPGSGVGRGGRAIAAGGAAALPMVVSGQLSTDEAPKPGKAHARMSAADADADAPVQGSPQSRLPAAGDGAGEIEGVEMASVSRAGPENAPAERRSSGPGIEARIMERSNILRNISM